MFVPTGIPWGRMAESLLLHLLVVTAILTVSNAVQMLMRHNPQVRLRNEIVHYDISEYLPPLDTSSLPAPKPRKGRPLLAKQKIISLQPSPDNFEQTIVSPVDVKLPANITLPNIVAWTDRPGVPSSVVSRTLAQMQVPALPASVIAPAPEPLQRKVTQLGVPNLETKVIEPPPSPTNLRPREVQITSTVIEPPPEVSFNPRAIHAPMPSVIEPPPPESVARSMGTINVANLAATVAAPKLPVPPQRVITLRPAEAVRPGGGAGSGSASAGNRPPVAPVGGINTGPNAGQLIALNLHPAVPKGPIAVPPGRRAGEFASGPEGTPDAPGTPEIKAGGNGQGGSGTDNAGSGKSGNLPAGITIGSAPIAPPASSTIVAGNPNPGSIRDQEKLMASTHPPRVGEITRERVPAGVTDSPTAVEDRIFGSKKIYTLALNTPNLASTGGSWIIRFAQLDDDHTVAPLSAPVATRTADPAFPPDLIREGYEGTVILYAIIHKDGTVDNIRVLRGLQGRLDQNACIALSRWKFRPGTKNGQAVDLEAVVQIPFRADRVHY